MISVLRQDLRLGGDVAAENGYQALAHAGGFLGDGAGSGLRWTTDQMGAELAREVKHEVLDRLYTNGVNRVETNAIYAIAGSSQARPDIAL